MNAQDNKYDKKESKKQKTISECLLFNAKWAIFQLYHGETQLHFNEKMHGDVRFVLDQRD